MTKELNILLAEDDVDDCFFFDEALKACAIPYILKAVENGKIIMVLLRLPVNCMKAHGSISTFLPNKSYTKLNIKKIFK